jgi:Spy/CpxP family protein refolding chaperone
MLRGRPNISYELSVLKQGVKFMYAGIKVFSFAIFAFGLALGVISVSAQERPAPPISGDAPTMGKMDGRHRMRGGHDRMMMRELRGIKLTDPQKEQIRIIQETYKPTQPEMDEMRTLMKAKHDGTLTDDQKTRMESLHAAQQQRMENIRTQVMGILTAEQKAQIETRKAEREKKRAERREKMKQRQNAPLDRQ